MSGIPNHRFSIKKGRQVSPLEAGVESIKRHFSISMGKNSRGSRQEEEARLSGLSTSTRRMPKSKDGQVEVNGDKRRSVNNSGWSEPTDTSDNEGILSAHGSGNDYGHNHSTSNSSGNRRNRGTTGSQSNLDLGPFTETASEAIYRMSATYKVLQALSESYKEHVRGIEEVSTTQARCIELEKMCKIQKDRIRVLKEMGEEKEAEFVQEMEDIKKERAGLEAEKKKFEEQKENADKRARTQEAEQKNKQENELEKLKKDQDKQYDNLKQQLQRDIKKKEDEAKKRMTDLEAANKTLSEQVEAQKAKIEAQEVESANAQEEYDILRRAKDSFKEEKQKLAKHLKMLEDDFALTSQPIEFYNEKFHKISNDIEAISFRYFKDLDNSDFDIIRERLIAADPCFSSVPISDTEDSQSLRIAHAQRIISSSLRKNIWQPFSSEKTLPHPDFVSLLSEIASDLAKPSPDGSSSGRVASAWTALTMRALESLSLTSPSFPTSTSISSPPAPASQTSASPPRLSRANKAINDVFNVLSPLVTPSQEANLRKDLTALANRAISVWRSAQTDELQFTVLPTLNRANRNEWRYERFDPTPSPGKDTEAEITSSTRPRIFTLFPRVIATQKASPAAEAPAGPPGSWPAARDEPRGIETCVHAGVGLPESSPLVLRGRAEEEEREEYIRKEVERMKQEEEEREEYLRERYVKIKQAANAMGGRRNSGLSRRDSVAGSVSGPPSPTQVKGESAMMTSTVE